MNRPNDPLEFDRRHLWHPYASMIDPLTPVQIESAAGVRLRTTDGRELIDGMSSWWCAIHGYSHPALVKAATTQLGKMSHVMFGGLTHEPAIELGRQLLDVAPDAMDTVFFADSGSVSVEVAIKMAIQYWHVIGHPKKRELLTIRSGYHGDTFGAMSVCDPVNGMHHLFEGTLAKHHFADAPDCRFSAEWRADALASFQSLIERHDDRLAAVILEPIVQGAGGMRFYHADYLRGVRQLCDQHDVLLIHDEIATGFGRTGKYFACEHADVAPDIMCVGKAITGGMMTLAATMSTRKVADGISDKGTSKFMHGPTFMANPLACAVASANLALLGNGDWKAQIEEIETGLQLGLEPAQEFETVRDVRVLGGIGVIEMRDPVDVQTVQSKVVELGVWLRPFGRLIYTMPPYIASKEDISQITSAMTQVAQLKIEIEGE